MITRISSVGLFPSCAWTCSGKRHGGAGFDVLTLDLMTMDADAAPATKLGNVISAALRSGLDAVATPSKPDITRHISAAFRAAVSTLRG
jgi:hypothetical protein